MYEHSQSIYVLIYVTYIDPTPILEILKIAESIHFF